MNYNLEIEKIYLKYLVQKGSGEAKVKPQKIEEHFYSSLFNDFRWLW